MRLSCFESSTATECKAEWFKRHAKNVEDMTPSEDEYLVSSSGATAADAVCMFTMMIQEVLLVKKIPLKVLAQKTSSAFDAMHAAFTATNFEGLPGAVKYGPTSGDLKGTVLVQQLQTGDAIVDIADFHHGSFHFLGKSNLVFHFPSEIPLAAPLVRPAL